MGVSKSDGEDPSRLIVPSLTRAADAGHLAAADIAKIASAIDAEYRLVGGNAVSLLVWHHQVTDLVPARETVDADFGAPSEVVGSPDLPVQLASRDYRREGGNRFVRTLGHGESSLDLAIDVLAPSYTGRLEVNQPHGDLHVDEIPGLALAIARPATIVQIEATLTTGQIIEYVVPLPDVISALCMKAYAYRWRFAARDALDVWRLLEAANKAGLTSADWPRSSTGRDAGGLLLAHFGTAASGGPAQATTDQAHQARIRALVRRVVHEPQS